MGASQTHHTHGHGFSGFVVSDMPVLATGWSKLAIFVKNTEMSEYPLFWPCLYPVLASFDTVLHGFDTFWQHPRPITGQKRIIGWVRRRHTQPTLML